MKQKTIIFMGTPQFSVPALETLVGQNEFQISLVVTQPDRPKGRGKQLAFSPVKEAALQLGLEVYQPESINSEESLKKLSDLQPDFFVVVAYGQILSEKILGIPKIYPINIHASLLPKYRGAAPIQAAILNMDKETGVTTMVMAKGMDTGDILLAAHTSLDPGETAQDLHDRLSLMGGQLILATLQKTDQITPCPQDHSQATYVTLLKKSQGKIDWNRSCQEICAHINAMTPWPGAFTFLQGKRIIVFKAIPWEKSASMRPDSMKPGTIFLCNEAGIHVTSRTDAVVITELMGASGKRLPADAFLRGHTIDLPARFESP